MATTFTLHGAPREFVWTVPQCPLRVISRHHGPLASRPLYQAMGRRNTSEPTRRSPYLIFIAFSMLARHENHWDELQ
jgi:hypothetical protein